MSKVTAIGTEASPDEETRAYELHEEIETKLSQAKGHLHFNLWRCRRGQSNIGVGFGRRGSYRGRGKSAR
jgi:hypothetical protein